MNAIAQGAALIGALSYLVGALAEIFFFRHAWARKFLKVEPTNLADVELWAFCIGFRNALAGITTIAGVVVVNTGNERLGRTLVVLGCGYMLLAGLAMGLADLLGRWVPRGGSVTGTIATTLPPAVALVAATF